MHYQIIEISDFLTTEWRSILTGSIIDINKGQQRNIATNGDYHGFFTLIYPAKLSDHLNGSNEFYFENIRVKKI